MSHTYHALHNLMCYRINELRCHSGQCVPRQAFCDGRLDCSDGSDEMLTVCSKTLQVLVLILVNTMVCQVK
jgi:hypothetical protein